MKHWPLELIRIVVSYLEVRPLFLLRLATISPRVLQLLPHTACTKLVLKPTAESISVAADLSATIYVETEADQKTLLSHSDTERIQNVMMPKGVLIHDFFLKKFPSLTHFSFQESLGRSENSFSVFSVLASFSNLTCLAIGPYNFLDGTAVQELAKCRNLSSLTLGAGNFYNPKDSQALAALHQLRHLRMFGSENPFDKETLVQFSNLVSLRFGDAIDSLPRVLQCLAHLSKLTALSFGDSNVMDLPTMTCIAQCVGLRALTFGSRNTMNACSFASLRCLSTLEQLTIGANCDFDDSCIASLNCFSRLEKFDLGAENSVSGMGLQHLAALSFLFYLAIGSWNNIGIDGCKTISECKQLASVKIGQDNNILSEGVYHLSTLPCLTTLELEAGNDVGIQGLNYLSNRTSTPLGHLILHKLNNLIDSAAQQQAIDMFSLTRVKFV